MGKMNQKLSKDVVVNTADRITKKLKLNIIKRISTFVEDCAHAEADEDADPLRSKCRRPKDHAAKLDWINMLLGSSLEAVASREELSRLFMFLTWVKGDPDC